MHPDTAQSKHERIQAIISEKYGREEEDLIRGISNKTDNSKHGTLILICAEPDAYAILGTL